MYCIRLYFNFLSGKVATAHDSDSCYVIYLKNHFQWDGLLVKCIVRVLEFHALESTISGLICNIFYMVNLLWNAFFTQKVDSMGIALLIKSWSTLCSHMQKWHLFNSHFYAFSHIYINPLDHCNHISQNAHFVYHFLEYQSDFVRFFLSW